MLVILCGVERSPQPARVLPYSVIFPFWIYN